LSTSELITVGILCLGIVLLLGSFVVQGYSLPPAAKTLSRQNWKYPNLFTCVFLVCYLGQIFLITVNYADGFMLLTSIVFLLWATFVVQVARLSHKSILKLTKADIEKSEITTKSQQHQLEATESQKLAAVGQLTGGLAHDFNNILGIVVGNLDEMQEALPPEYSQIHSQLASALAAALAGVEVSRGLLAVARREQKQIQAYNLNTLIGDIMPLIHSAVGSSVTVRAQLTARKLICRVNGSGLDNVILNLVINARDAMRSLAGSMVLTLRTNGVNIQSGFDDRLSPGWYALVEVSDTGVGMNEALLKQIFQPFFTTKGQGEGTGLGMSMVSRYVEEAGGIVLVESTEGAGTAVRLYLPLEKAQSGVLEAAESHRAKLFQHQNSAHELSDAGFDLLAAEAARTCRVPIAFILTMDEPRQSLKASVGIDGTLMLDDERFFPPATQDAKHVLVVPDARVDPRFSQSPLVIAESAVRFYAAAPIVNTDGCAVGVLCVIDGLPNTLAHWLQALAERAMRLMDGSRQSDSIHAKLAGGKGTDSDTPVLKKGDISSVLVVDDEVALCELSAIWLTSLGCKVTIAHSAAEALEHLSKKRYAILFTDIVMPGGMDGVELARKALLLQTHLKVLITSGYADRLSEDKELPGELISKPYRKIDLINAISRL
jgi:signal transduction histidine kinase/CheY-like chemotaxis protein